MTAEHEQPERAAYCLFQDGCRSLAIEVGHVIELIDCPPLVVLPLSPRPLLGLAAYRGGILPIVTTNPGDRPDLDASSSRSGVLILHAAQGIWGLAVVRQGVSVVEAAPDEMDPDPGLPSFVQSKAGIVVTGRRMAVLDPEGTWITLRDGITRWYGELMGDEVNSPLKIA